VREELGCKFFSAFNASCWRLGGGVYSRIEASLNHYAGCAKHSKAVLEVVRTEVAASEDVGPLGMLGLVLGTGRSPRPEPWLPYVFTSPEQAAEAGFSKRHQCCPFRREQPRYEVAFSRSERNEQVETNCVLASAWLKALGRHLRYNPNPLMD